MGRPTKYRREIVDAIIAAIEAGATYDLAAAAAGISTDTLGRWRKEKPLFAELMREAEGKGAVKLLRVIDTAAVDDWRAAAWKLERRYPREYGRTVQEQEHSGDVKIVVEYVEAPRAT